jgi:putative membrane protein insertion efficiency factor
MRSLLLMKVLLLGPSLLCLSYNMYAQNREEVQSLKQKPSKQTESPYLAYSQQGSGEVNLFAGMLFRFYKKFISSQDYGNCSFIPSCSEYAVIAIRKQGLLIGSISTLDRLTRCHPKNNRHYPTDEEKGLLIDEVRNHNYEKK